MNEEIERLQRQVVDAALALFGATRSAAFVLPILNTTPPLYLACGEADQIRDMLPRLHSVGVDHQAG